MASADRRHRPIVVVTAALAVALFAAALISSLAFGSGDDAGTRRPAVVLHNPSHSVLTVKRCDDGCDGDGDRVLAGGDLSARVAGADATTSWAVSDATGAPLGCVRVRHADAAGGVVVDLSRRTRCPKAAGSGTVGTVLAIALFLATGAVGLASIVFGTLWAHRRLRRDRPRGGRTGVLTSLVAVVMFLGGWLLFDLFVVVGESAWMLRRRTLAT